MDKSSISRDDGGGVTGGEVRRGDQGRDGMGHVVGEKTERSVLREVGGGEKVDRKSH